jgi:starvation-inducible DNA-binding protein
VVNDEGSNAMMSDFIAEQEKTIWMMQAFRRITDSFYFIE